MYLCVCDLFRGGRTFSEGTLPLGVKPAIMLLLCLICEDIVSECRSGSCNKSFGDQEWPTHRSRTNSLNIHTCAHEPFTNNRSRTECVSFQTPLRSLLALRWVGIFGRIQRNGLRPWEVWTFKGHVEVKMSNGSGIWDPQFEALQFECMITDRKTNKKQKMRH